MRKWTVLADNYTNNDQLESEHGLSILLETDKSIIFCLTQVQVMSKPTSRLLMWNEYYDLINKHPKLK